MPRQETNAADDAGRVETLILGRCQRQLDQRTDARADANPRLPPLTQQPGCATEQKQPAERAKRSNVGKEPLNRTKPHAPEHSPRAVFNDGRLSVRPGVAPAQALPTPLCCHRLAASHGSQCIALSPIVRWQGR